MKKNSNIIRFYVGNSPEWNSIKGKFRHIKSDGEVYLIGGTARHFINGCAINDYDFTVIGGTYFNKDQFPKGNKRVEVEYEALNHNNIKDYMSTRDLTINQVMVDKYGYLYITKKALSDYKNGIIRLVGTEPTPRELVRAVRFSKEYNYSLDPCVVSYIKDAKEQMLLGIFNVRYDTGIQGV